GHTVFLRGNFARGAGKGRGGARLGSRGGAGAGAAGAGGGAPGKRAGALGRAERRPVLSGRLTSPWPAHCHAHRLGCTAIGRSRLTFCRGALSRCRQRVGTATFAVRRTTEGTASRRSSAAQSRPRSETATATSAAEAVVYGRYNTNRFPEGEQTWLKPRTPRTPRARSRISLSSKRPSPPASARSVPRSNAVGWLRRW